MVLRLTVRGERRDFRSAKPRVVLGAGPTADVRVEDADWQAVEAVVDHRGTELRVTMPSGSAWRLRVGDDLRLGRVRISLLGLLPLDAANSSGEALSDPPVFGGYDEGLVPPSPFELVDELAPLPAPPTEVQRPEPGSPTQSAVPATTEEAPAPAPPPPRRPPSPAFVSPTFGEELVAQLRRAPYFTISVAVHLMVFLVLALIQDRTEAGRNEGEGRVLSLAALDPADLEERGTEEPERDDPLLPEPDLPEMPEPEPPEVEATDPRRPPEPPEDLAALPDPGGLPFPIGLNPSLSAAGRPTKLPVPVPDADLRRPFAKGDMGWANQKAAEFVRADLGRGTGRQGDPLAVLVRRDLLVVEGSFDRIGQVLSSLRLPYVRITPLSLTFNNAPDLSQHKVVYWNCGEALPPGRLDLVSRRLRAFVKNGGYLFTTDWAVGNVLMPTFPGYLSSTGPVATLPEAVVRIEPARGQRSHPLLRGVFHAGVQGLWWLERASFDVRLGQKPGVTVLIESPDLDERYHRSPIVAATFRYGKGRVLHISGHYFQEMGNLAGTITAHRLALNFLLERIDADSARR